MDKNISTRTFTDTPEFRGTTVPGATENASTENASTSFSKCAMANGSFVDK